jgi:hypothetical protein
MFSSALALSLGIAQRIAEMVSEGKSEEEDPNPTLREEDV